MPSNDPLYYEVKQGIVSPTEENPAYASTFGSIDPYAPTAWGKPAEQDFTCPSGQRCLVRRIDIMDLLGSGLLNSLDFLTAIVQDQHIPNAHPGPKQAVAAMQGLTGSPEKMAEFKKTIEQVVLRVVVKPELHPVPDTGVHRVPGRVYVDSVAMTDQIAIFNWAVTGQESEDLKRFRDEADQPVGNVESREVVQHETVNLPRDPDHG